MYTREYLNPFRIGADPEFAVLDSTGEYVNAQELMGEYSGQVGYDHGGRVLELRPFPTKSVYKLLENCRELLSSEKLVPFKAAKWLAGAAVKTSSGRTLSLGGHMHLELACPQEPMPALATPEIAENWRQFSAVVRSLDRLSSAYEELDIFPSASCKDRKASGYGRLGDVRSSNEGKTTEYRVPPSWLFSPAVAYCALTGYKLAAIQPDATNGLGTNPTLAKLKDFFGRFAGDDRDAARVVTRLSTQGLKGVQGDPTQDIRKAWAVE